MRVPVNPQTRVPQGQLGYGRNVDISSGVQALGRVVSAYAEQLEQDNKKREVFDVQKMLVDETNALQLDFEERVKVQPLGAPDFTPTINSDYTARHDEMVKGLYDRGYSEDTVNEFATRLGSIRSQYVAKAIDFQDKSGFAKVITDTKDMATSLSQYVSKNPNAVQSALDEMRVGLTHTNLDAVEQEQVFEANKEVILQGAREGFVLQNPEMVMDLFAPGTRTTTVHGVEISDGGPFSLEDYFEKVRPVEGTGKNKRSSAVGHFQFLKGTWLETYKEVYGQTGESEDKILAKRKDNTVATKLAEWFTSKNVAQLTRAGVPVNNATVYLAHFLGVDDAIKVLSAHADATIESLVTPASRKANPGVFKKIENAADMLTWASQKMGGSGEPTTRVVTEETIAQSLATLDPSGKSGIPAIDLATGPQRLRMLEYARTIINARDAATLAQQKAAHDQWFNGFLNQLQDGKLGQADLNQAYAEGKITDFDDRKKAQGILDAKNKKEDDLARFGVMLRSGIQFNPYDKEAQNAVDAGFAKAVEVTTKTGENASPFVIALRTWQRTGVLPTQGGVMIRGSLIGTNPEQVAAAASVASNMLKQNPNAFAGVQGGEDIGRAAANYAHYVDDLGLTAQEAAQKIALQNSPEFQAKVKADEPKRNAFVKQISEANVEEIVNRALGGSKAIGAFFGRPRGEFVSPPQEAEARQTFAELATTHYDKYHDEAAARAYATRQMSRFYGIEGERLMKYPPRKAYPEVMGSREYVYDQAKSFVDEYVGFEVPKEDVFLQPTASGSTAAAFRAGKPAPYEVHYVTRKDGQVIYHHIPGKVFVADLDEARRAAAIYARKVEQEARKRKKPVSLMGAGL